MNKRQKIVFGLMAIIIASVFLSVPRYKIVKLDAYGQNYIKTKSGSSLYKRCKSPVQFEWQKIIRSLAPVVIIGLLLIILLRDREKIDAP
jgi:hypothetical protein